MMASTPNNTECNLAPSAMFINLISTCYNTNLPDLSESARLFIVKNYKKYNFELLHRPSMQTLTDPNN